MRQNGYITDREYALAVETPLNMAKGASAIARRAVLRRPGERLPAEQVSG